MNTPFQPSQTDLPPPPAPVARDANPWQWPKVASERPRSKRANGPNPRLEHLQRLRRARDEAGTAPPAPAAPVPAPPGAAAPSAATPRKRDKRGGLAAIVPFGMFLIAIGVIASGALDALRDGAGFGAFLPLLVFALIFGIGALRRARRGERD
jgi:hypothetical protein